WLILVFMLGMALCKARTERVEAPVLSGEDSQFYIDALVLDITGQDKENPRIVVAPLRMSGLSADNTPIRLRLGLRNPDPELKPGQRIKAFAIVHPPAGPSLPGGYDFARSAWFDAYGGVGFIPGRIDISEAPEVSDRLRRQMCLNGFRWQLTQTIVAKMEGQLGQGTRLGGFAAALVTGHQAYLEPDLVSDMRDSGLAHILSISGLHMAIVGGFSFFLSRAIMALIPPLVLNFPVKKLAAGFGILTVCLYLAISGAPAPAIRAAIVAIVAFGAILIDRRALSLRALALAAIIVIILTPEAVFEVGFQMSFCATAALLALAETVRPVPKEISVPVWVRFWQGGWRWVRLTVVASTVAGLATAPFGIFYFNRAQLYSLPANMLEAPVTALVVMPALAIGTTLSGTPLGQPFLYISGLGLHVVDRISMGIANLPGAVAVVASPPDIALLLSFAGIVWLCLIRGTARWIGLVAAFAVLYWPRISPPDIWLDPQGANAAIRIDQETYALRPKVQQFGYEKWLEHYHLKTEDTLLDQHYICKSYVCVPTSKAEYEVGFAFGNQPVNIQRLESLCRESQLVVIRSEVHTWPAACEGVNRITKPDFQRLGAMELRRTEGQWHIRASEPLRGQRPWTRRLSDSGA
ncbi:MAG: ComEC/Rec2 family competence protein, partial [Asticcacaulis sp.]